METAPRSPQGGGQHHRHRKAGGRTAQADEGPEGLELGGDQAGRSWTEWSRPSTLWEEQKAYERHRKFGQTPSLDRVGKSQTEKEDVLGIDFGDQRLQEKENW